jgi:hypothetical protein
MLDLSARLEINNFCKEQERQKHETIQGSVKKKGFSKFQKRTIYKRGEMWSCKKKLIEEKKHVEIIEHEKLHFNCEIGEIEQLDVNAGQRPLDMEKK